MSAVLEVRGLEKAFGGIRAVNGVSFEVREGEILGLIGPNGSGKSTLFNCILGQLAPSAGEVRIDGRAITGKRPCQLNRLGVGRTFQLLYVDIHSSEETAFEESAPGFQPVGRAKVVADLQAQRALDDILVDRSHAGDGDVADDLPGTLANHEHDIGFALSFANVFARIE